VWIILMSILSQIRNTGSQRNSIDKGETAQSLVAALRETERALGASIEAEEERTGLHDYNDPQYSMLARSMRHRLDNLKVTIATLEAVKRAA
jgi:hypothetical protein